MSMDVRCGRCGIATKDSTGTCPGCGAPLGTPRDAEEEPDYYTLFELSPQMPYSEISARLCQAARIWTKRSSSAAKMEQRHKAERMVQRLAEAEALLLKPASRAAYDARWRQRQSDSGYSSFDSTRPTDRSVDTPARPVPATESESAGNADPSVERNWLGWTTVRGIVIHLDRMYTIPPPRSWLRIVLAIVLFPIMALVGLFVLSFWIATRIMFPRFTREMGITNFFFLLFTLHRAGESRSQVPVRDLRVRDNGNVEHSVRLVGRLVGASVNVGDDVTLSGFSWGGTINARRGINHRTRSVIRVRT
jgi:hypothetical protein